MNKSRLLSIAVLICMGAAGQTAFAGLIQENYRTPGDDLVILDTTTGNTWIAATVTLGDSPNQALAANPGYQLATLPQLVTLLEDAGITPADINAGAYFTSDSAAQNNFSRLFQLTDYWTQYYGAGASGWEYIGYGNLLDSAGTGWGEESLDSRNAPLGGDGAYSTYIGLNNCLGCSSSLNFDFLVAAGTTANAPEPGTLSLLALSALVLLAFAVQRGHGRRLSVRPSTYRLR